MDDLRSQLREFPALLGRSREAVLSPADRNDQALPADAANSLVAVVEAAVPYEGLAVEVDRPLRWAAWTGLGMLSVFLLIALIGDPYPASPKPSFFIFGWEAFQGLLAAMGTRVVSGVAWMALALLAGLAVYTESFRLGSSWTLDATMIGVSVAFVASGMLFALATILILNLALWVAYGALMLFLGLSLMAFIFNVFLDQ